MPPNSSRAVYCECGNERRRGKDACDRCLFLDGDHESQAAIIGALRAAGASSTEGVDVQTIAQYTGDESVPLRHRRRIVDLNMPPLLRTGRVRKVLSDDGERTLYYLEE